MSYEQPRSRVLVLVQHSIGRSDYLFLLSHLYSAKNLSSLAKDHHSHILIFPRGVVLLMIRLQLKELGTFALTKYTPQTIDKLKISHLVSYMFMFGIS